MTSRLRLGKTLALPIRKLDGTGRITLPHAIRRKLEADTFTVEHCNGAIIIRPVGQKSCQHCAGTGFEEFTI